MITPQVSLILVTYNSAALLPAFPPVSLLSNSGSLANIGSLTALVAMENALA
jgi:hypothetical protein